MILEARGQGMIRRAQAFDHQARERGGAELVVMRLVAAVIGECARRLLAVPEFRRNARFPA